MELGEKIRRRRLELGMSQADLADALGYTNRATVAKVESGVNDLTQSKIERYAEALRTTPAYLMDWTDDPYDYDLDPDGRFDSISKPLLEELMDQYHNDAEAVWHAYENMQTASLMDASKEDGVMVANRILKKYNTLAKEAAITARFDIVEVPHAFSKRTEKNEEKA